ncbi:hypothetical protein [Actinomadura sp. 9N407]|uniref:hypothetical protein n=1 Tax=Actinomadura sp. 9N407 TaxID=3375154 RepID=UPI00379925C1
MATAAATTTARPVPRWVVWTARVTALTALPSGLWRFAMGLGVPLGFAEGSDLADFPHPIGTPYVFGLSILVEALALLTLGLVRPWGEVFPRWIPFLGGRRVPTMAAVTAATLGAVAMTLITFLGMGGWLEQMSVPEAPDGAAAVLMTACYAPLLAWGPLLLIVTGAYFLRRTGKADAPFSSSDFNAAPLS